MIVHHDLYPFVHGKKISVDAAFNSTLSRAVFSVDSLLSNSASVDDIAYVMVGVTSCSEAKVLKRESRHHDVVLGCEDVVKVP